MAASISARVLPPTPCQLVPFTSPERPTTLSSQPLRRPHVVFWLQRDLQDFGVAHNLLIAGGGDSFSRDPVHLVEGVGFKDPLISRPNEDLKPQGLVFHVAMELGGRKQNQIITGPLTCRMSVSLTCHKTPNT